jgi:hypothetical protein
MISKLDKKIRMNLCSFLIDKYNLTGCLIHQMDKDSDEFIQLFITSDDYLDINKLLNIEKETKKYISYHIGYQWTENIDVTTIDNFITTFIS